MIVLGIDPDLHTTAIAGYCTLRKQVTLLSVVRVPPTFKDRSAAIKMCREVEGMLFDETRVVVEGQSVRYTSKKGANPQDIVHLAMVAGACIQRAEQDGAQEILCPLPSEWKGTVPKHIHQARILSELGWPYETIGRSTKAYARPASGFEGVFGAETLNKGDWKHVVDAIGLAMWGAKKGAVV